MEQLSPSGWSSFRLDVCAGSAFGTVAGRALHVLRVWSVWVTHAPPRGPTGRHRAQTGPPTPAHLAGLVPAPGAGAGLGPGWGRGSETWNGLWVPGLQRAQPAVPARGSSPPSGRPSQGPDRPRLSRWPSASSLVLAVAGRGRRAEGAEGPGRSGHLVKAPPPRCPFPLVRRSSALRGMLSCHNLEPLFRAGRQTPQAPASPELCGA